MKKAKSSLKDSRDGKTYNAIKIGEQVWMSENLNYETGNSLCYENKEENCRKYGRLYDWATANKACPSGWHLPSDAEWTALENAVGGSSTAGMVLKSRSGWDNNGNGLDTYGFSALPCGNRLNDGDFYYAGFIADFWSATEDDADFAWLRGLDAGDADMGRGYNIKILMFSVRCFRD